MKKSKHFRKDVIMARVIAAVALLVLIILLVFVISLFTKPSGSDKNSQDTQNTQNTQDVTPGSESQATEPDVNIDTESAQETEAESDSEADTDGKVYVQTTTQVKLRKEPNTECATLDRIDGGTKLEVLETLDGWYKVIHNGQEGYVSATYAEVVEE